MVTHRELVADIWEDILHSGHLSEEHIIRDEIENKWGQLSDTKYRKAFDAVYNIISKKAGY